MRDLGTCLSLLRTEKCFGMVETKMNSFGVRLGREILDMEFCFGGTSETVLLASRL